MLTYIDILDIQNLGEGTFHAFCAALLREYPIEAQIDPYFRVMDETDKIFFLRRIIDRSINELAEQKDHPDLSILSQEWSKTGIAYAIYAMIQKRENTGIWLRDFQNFEWENFQQRLEKYKFNILRGICYKLIASNQERGTHQKTYRLSPTQEIEKDYHQEYEEKLPQDHNVKAGEIFFDDNFRSAKEPITFFNLFFQILMGQEYYEDYEARSQRLICSGNQWQGSVELLLVNRDADKADDALQTTPEMEDIDVYTKKAHLIAAKIKEVLTGDELLYDHVRQEAAAKRPAIAILLNRRTKLKIYEEALQRENIDVIVVRGRGFFQQQEIVDMGNLLGFFD